MNFILTPCICVSHVTVPVTWFDLFVLDMKTETACEGKTLDIRCKKGMTIDIESAIYGRLSSKTCKAGSNIDTTNCASRKSTDKVKQKCNGHRNCNVRVSNWKMGGDPCYGVTKYLSVRYACVGKSDALVLKYL